METERPFLKRSYRLLILLLLAFFAFGFHLVNLDFASYDLDEAVHVWHAQKSYGEVIAQASNDPNPPIYNLIISAWVKQFGVSEFSTRLFSVLMGVFGTVIMYLVATRNFGLFVGVLAALLYTLSPIQFRFTHLARPYAMLMVTVLLSYGFMFECIRRQNGWKLFAYFITTSLMIYVHPTSVFNIPAQMLIVFIRKRKNLKAVLPLLALSVLSVASFLIWVFSIPYFERNEAMWFDAPDLKAISYVIGVFYASPWLIAVQGVLLLYFIQKYLVGSSKRGLDMAGIAIWCIVPLALSIGFSHFVKPVFQDKYILSVQPAIIMLLAVSINQLAKPLLKTLLGAVCVLLLLANADFTRDSEGDWKGAVEYVRPLHNDSSLILIDPWYELQTFAFYFDREAYENPYATSKHMGEEGVFTSWENVYDVQNAEPYCKVLHILQAHQGHVTPVVSKEVLDTVATLGALKTFSGVAVRSYVFGVSLDTMEVLTDGFETQNGGVLKVTHNEEFADVNNYTLSTANPDRILKITGALDVVAGNELSGVNFVITVEREDGSAIIYESINAEGELRKKKQGGKRLEFSVSAIGFDKTSVVKTYLWNSKRAHFEVDNFQLILEN